MNKRFASPFHCNSEYDYEGVPPTSQGTGAFSLYHGRWSYAMEDVEAGAELFVSYGSNYFRSRDYDFALVPLRESYPPATRFMSSFGILIETLTALAAPGSTAALEGTMADLLDVAQDFPYKSRPLGAIPKRYSVAKRALEVGIEHTEYEASVRPLAHLDEHGKCLDNLRPAASSIAHAGRGAVATKFIPKGGYVSIAPLLHIPDRDVLTMYADTIDPQTGEEARILTEPVGHQLLRNYCFGHNESSLLLCPYDPVTPYINHDGEAPNAKITWSQDPAYDNAAWRERPVRFFDNVWRGGLAFEYVALADIEPGDEVTIDYGEQWEAAWVTHVQRWQPRASLEDLAQNFSIPIPIRGEDHDLRRRYIKVWCHCPPAFNGEERVAHIWQEDDMDADERQVELVKRTRHPIDGSHSYTVEAFREADGESYAVRDVPRKALFLQYTTEKYRGELFMKGVFRHEM